MNTQALEAAFRLIADIKEFGSIAISFILVVAPLWGIINFIISSITNLFKFKAVG